MRHSVVRINDVADRRKFNSVYLCFDADACTVYSQDALPKTRCAKYLLYSLA